VVATPVKTSFLLFFFKVLKIVKSGHKPKSTKSTKIRVQVDRNLMLYLPRLAFSSASKPIDLGLDFQVHWVHIKLGFAPSTLVGTLTW
jgi:hypothetical protein